MFVILFILILLMTACQHHNYAAREIETIDNKSLMPFIARLKYRYAISQLDHAGMISEPGNYDSLKIKLSGSVKSLMNNEYFNFIPRIIVLANNNCKILQLSDQISYQAVPLQLCYIANKIYIDHDTSDQSSNIFYPSAFWLTGVPLTGIDTTGVANLQNAQLRIIRITKSGEIYAPYSN